MVQKRLRMLGIGGEAVTVQVVEAWVCHGYAIETYEPAETIVRSSAYRMTPGSRRCGKIGSGNSSKIWTTDRSNTNRLMPVGAPGKALIEAPILARE